MQVSLINALEDNYIFCLQPDSCPHSGVKSKSCTIIDPGESQPLFDFLDKQNLTVDHVLLTHHHHDHIGGVAEIVKKYECRVYGFENDLEHLPVGTIGLNDKDDIEIIGRKCRVHHIPGHTKGHVLYHFYEDNICFVGDTLFSMGCGRCIDGTPQQLFDSLSLIRTMTPETIIYCAHEYTVANTLFARSLYVDSRPNDAFLSYERLIHEKRAQNTPTIPFCLKDELRLNPFLGVFLQEYRQKIGLGALSALDAFIHLRQKKDAFRV